jgi:hypothetical protein
MEKKDQSYEYEESKGLKRYHDSLKVEEWLDQWKVETLLAPPIGI